MPVLCLRVTVLVGPVGSVGPGVGWPSKLGRLAQGSSACHLYRAATEMTCVHRQAATSREVVKERAEQADHILFYMFPAIPKMSLLVCDCCCCCC